MKTLQAQLEQVIKDNAPKTMNVSVPYQNNIAENELLIKILRNQEEIQERIKNITVKLSIIDTKINCLPFANKYPNTNWY